MQSDHQSYIFRIACFLTLLSGAAALGHQLLWTRRMVDLLGATGESTARVFGAFFLGLAIGAVLAGWLAKRARRPWWWLAWAELSIVILSLPILFLPSLATQLWQWGGPGIVGSVTGMWLKTALSLLLLTPPAILMGFFLPLMARAVLLGKRHLAREGLFVYGCNTLGGAVGLWLVAWFCLPAFGAWGSMLAVMACNLLVMAACMVLAVKQPALPDPENQAKNDRMKKPAVSAKTVPVSPVWIYCLAFLSGFCILAAEIAFFQMLMLAAPLSFHTAAGLLLVVILALALGAFAAPHVTRLTGGQQKHFPWLLCGAGLAAMAGPFLFHLSVSVAGFNLFAASGLHTFSLMLLGLAWWVLGPAFVLAGLVFPTLCAIHETECNDRSGRGWGLLLAVNGLGGFAGAELAYGVIMPAVGIYGTIAIIGLVYLTAAGLLLVLRGRISQWLVPAGVAALIALVMAWHLPGLPTTNPRLPFTVLERIAGRDGSIAVLEGPQLGRAILVYNQYQLGNSGNEAEQARIGTLPLLLHPAPAHAAYIGLATGITPGAALDLESVQSIEVAELSPAIIALSERWFSPYNRDIHNNPRARIHAEDGRVFAAANKAAFDVVVGDLFLPWGPGEARLYSVEHFTAVRRTLREGGLFMQWLPMHQLDEPLFNTILNSFADVFPNYDVFIAGFLPQAPLIGLAGWKGDSALNWETVMQRVADEKHALRDPLLRHAEGLAMLYLGNGSSLPIDSQGTRNTLDNMTVEIRATHKRLQDGGINAFLTGQRGLDFQRNLFEQLDRSSLPEHWQHLPGMAATFGMQAMRPGGPDPRQLEALRRQMPTDMLFDRQADWQAWPGPRPGY